MKRQFLLIWLVVVSISLPVKISAYILDISTGLSKEGYDVSMPVREVKEDSNGITVTYKFNNINIVSDNLFTQRYIPIIPGFNTHVGENSFALPEHLDYLSIPSNCNGALALLKYETRDYQVGIAPAKLPITEWESQPLDSTSVTIPAFPSFFPTTPVKLLDLQKGLAVIEVSPALYNEKTKTLKVPVELSYRINFIPTEFDSPIDSHEDIFSNIKQQICINPSSQQITTGYVGACAYIIVTTPSLLPAVNRFAEWKKRLGYEIKILCRNTWTTDLIQSEIATAYRNLTNPKYLLIVGNHENIPGKPFDGHDSYVVSDYDYTVINNNEFTYLPDLYKGRIIANTLDEANVVVDKIINYEMNPSVEDLYYKTVLHSTYFEDRPPYDGKADRSYPRVTENLSNYMISNGKNVRRAYFANGNCNPVKWDQDDWNGSLEVPDYLKRPNFNWNADADLINNYINKGVLYAFHRDHGEAAGWSYPKYYANNINLTNKNKLPVIFSIDCSCGTFNRKKCFAEEILKYSDGGGVAVIAASDLTRTDYNDIFAEGIFKSIWPSNELSATTNSETPQGIYRLGEILIRSLLQCRSEDHFRAYHIFGDPGMMMLTEKPTAIENVKVTRKTNSVSVTCDSKDVSISFYDYLYGTQYTANSSSGVFDCTSPNSVSVVIWGHNKIPYVEWYQSGTLIIQNQEINSDRVYSAEKIILSSDRDDLIPTGEVIIKKGVTHLKANEIELSPETIINLGAELKTTIVK